MSESASTSTASTPPTTTPAAAAAAAAAAAGAGTGAASQISRQDLILLVQKLQKRATTAEQTVTSLKTKLEAAQAEIAASKAAAAATTSTTPTSTSTIDPVKEQLIKDQQHQIEKLTQQCATLQAAATTAAAASTSQASTSVISSTSSTDTTLIQSLEQQIEQHKTELSSLRVQLQRIESERDATIAKLTQQHNTELQTTLNNVQDLKREREQLRREIESLKTTAAATTSSPAEAPKATSPSPDMESFHQLQASNAKLNAAILELENNNAKLAETLLKKKAQIKTLEKEYNEFKEKTKADLATVEAKSTAADQRLVKTFQLLTAEKNTVKEQNEAMEELRRTLTRTQSDAAELIQQQQAVMTQSQKTIEQLQHDYNMLKQELIRREENEDNNLDHQRELQRKIEENRELLSELEHERMIRERERLQRDRDAAMDKEERERMLDDFEREKLRLTREHNEAITAAETKIKQLLAKVKAGAKKLKEMTAEETELKAKLEAAEAATAACRAEITSLHAEHTRLTTDFESEKLSINTRHNERYEKLLRELKTVKDNNNKTINEQAIRLQELTAQVMKLEEEIATGKPSERRIFELANLQARREEQVQRSQMEMSQLKAKNKEYKSKLRMVLDERDFLSDQVKQLTKSRSRAQVNLDYLKSIMVRFISFENRHPQRRALIPVIATILQFTEEDLKTIEESSGTGQQSGWLSKMSGGWLGSNTETPVPHLPTSNSLPLHLTVSSTVNLDPVVPDHGVNDRIAKPDAVSRQLQLELADEAKGQHSQHGSRRGSNPNSRPFTPTSLATDNYSPLSSPNSIPSSASSYSRRLQANAAANTPNTNNTTHHTHSSADRHIVSSSSSPFTFTSSSITSPTPSSQPHSSHPNGNGDTHSPSQPQPQQISAPTTTTAPTATRASDVDDLFGAVEVQQ